MCARLRSRALSLSTSSCSSNGLVTVVVGAELEPGGLVAEPVGGGEHEDRHATARSHDVFGDLAGGAGDVTVGGEIVVDVDAQQFQGGVAITGDVRRDRCQAQPIADGLLP